MVYAKRIIIFLFLGISLLNAQKVEVKADNIFINEKLLFSELTGNVSVKKGNTDSLTSKKLNIYFDKNKQPLKYVAQGNAKFKGLLDGKHYEGKAQKIIYEPQNSKYTLIGDAFIREIDTDKRVYGNKINVDEVKGTYEVEGDNKKPVRLIFDIEEKK